MWREVAISVALVLMAGSAQAQDFLAGLSTKCGSDPIERVELETLLADPSPWHGKCVEARGYKAGSSLLVEADETVTPYAQSSDRLAAQRIGIYGSDKALDRLHRASDGTYLAVTGRVSDCRSLQGPDVIMVMGYCHYTAGPILIMGDFKQTREPPRLRARPGEPE